MKCEVMLKQTATRRQVIAGLAFGAGATASYAADVVPDEHENIDRTAESIRQQVEFTAPPQRLYAALLDARQFQQVVLLGAAVRSGMVKATPPAHIGVAAGAAFSIFGGFITGRQIELVPKVRIVQAWRPAEWPAGVYSIARFELAGYGSGTRLVFEHTGFPKGDAQHLAEGWKVNYWQPLEQFLS